MAWKNLVTHPNVTAGVGAGWCLVYAQNVLGAPAQNPSAWQAWLNAGGRHPGELPPQNIVPLWFEHWGTYGSPPTYGNWGHVAVLVPGDAIYSSPEGGFGYKRYSTISEVERAFNAKYVGWSEFLNGKRIVEKVSDALTPTQRKAGSLPVKRRNQPTTKSAEKQPMLNAGEIGNFDGWINGETVEGNKIWFRGISGDFFWSGAFTSTSTKGLKDLNPSTPKPPTTLPTQRTAGANPVKRRTGPTTKSAEKQPMLKAGEIGNFTHWAKGEQVFDGIKNTGVWFRGISGDWFWSGGFTSQSTAGLKEWKEEKPKPPVTPPPLQYKDPEITNLTAADFPKWIVFDEVADNETAGMSEKDWNLDLYSYYKAKGVDEQYRPIELHAHWWGDPATKPSHSGTVDHLKSTEGVTVNFVISAGRVTSMLPLRWIATTTGLRNPFGWKVEVDPQLTEEVYKTLGAVIFLVEKKNPRLLKEPIRLHKEFMATACSEIKVDTARAWAERFRTGEYDINTGQPAVQADSLESIIKELEASIAKLKKL